MFAWVMMGLAIWHFTIWLPDRFWGGIVGAFVFSIIGSVIFGLIVNGFTIPGQSDTTIVSALEAIPGRAHRPRPVLRDRRAQGQRARDRLTTRRAGKAGLQFRARVGR